MAEKQHEIIVKLPEGKEAKCILREPNFEVYGMAMVAGTNSTGKFNEIAAGKFVLDTCWVEGDEIIKKDTKAYVSAAWEAYDLISIYTAELKKK